MFVKVSDGSGGGCGREVGDDRCWEGPRGGLEDIWEKVSPLEEGVDGSVGVLRTDLL